MNDTNKNIVLLGGGTGMSTLLKGLKLFPINITSIVNVTDDGKSTGILREEFKTPAVGDVRRVLVALSETEPLVEELFNYRFDQGSCLKGHTLGNILLTACTNITGNLSDGVESLGKVLNLKGKVLPITNEDITLLAEAEDGTVIKGEANITKDKRRIKKVYFDKEPKINEEAITDIKNADLIILSMGSIYTSIAPLLASKEIKKAIDSSKAEIMYICNLMTQPGETENFTVSDHVKTLNQYLANKKIDLVIANNGEIPNDVIKRYCRLEEKDPVEIDLDKLNELGLKIKIDNYFKLENNLIKHNAEKVSLDIYSYLVLNQ